MDEQHGRWGRAQMVPGLAALSMGQFSEITVVSCAVAVDCAAGGIYTDRSGHQQAFVVDEKDGRRGRAELVPGLAALNTGNHVYIGSLSCTAAGTCSAGGGYLERSRDGLPFVVSEKNGTWGKAEEVPAMSALNKGAGAGILSLSCASADNCSAGGQYDGANSLQAFIVSRT